MRIVVAAILGLFIIPARADDELEFCAVVISAPAGYIILHATPGSKFGTRAKLVVDDLLYADTSRCSIWDDGACTDSHTHVYSVHRTGRRSARQHARLHRRLGPHQIHQGGDM